MKLPMKLPVLFLSIIKKLNFHNTNQLFIGILAAAVVLGGITGYLLANKNTTKSNLAILPAENPKAASQDSQTFRDFAEGVIQKRPPSKNPNEYVEGTHFLVRAGAVSVALTSSVVDLSLYEGKQVRVLGETQKAIKEGWLMDVGKVEVK